jgi:hypothetical protein
LKNQQISFAAGRRSNLPPVMAGSRRQVRPLTTTDTTRISGFGVPLHLFSRYNGEIPWLQAGASQSDFSDEVAGE